MKNSFEEYPNEWMRYGQWRHPKEWWQNALIQYIKKTCPDKLVYNPMLCEIKPDKIVFGMRKHYGCLVLSKKKIIEVLYPMLN